MSYTISKEFRFEAAHQLLDLPDGHKCRRLHGHSYTVAVELVAHELVAPGFVADFGRLDVLGRHLQETFDHRLLNDVLAVPPTSEHLAEHLFRWCQVRLLETLPAGVQLAAVRVSETPRTWAEFRVNAAGTAGG